MKNSIFGLFVFALFLTLGSCKNESKPTETPAATTETPAATPAETPATTPAAGEVTAPPAATTPEPAQNAKGVWHFTCAKGCEGGAGAAGNCAKCNGPLSHNQAYHQQ